MDEETRHQDPAVPDEPRQDVVPPTPAPGADPVGTTDPIVATDSAGDRHKLGGGARALAVLAALILAFLAAVAVVASIEIGDLTPCEEVTSASQLSDSGECFDGSDTEKTASLALSWPGAIFACLAVLLTLGVAIRGRGTGLAVKVTVAAAVLFGLGILVGSL